MDTPRETFLTTSQLAHRWHMNPQTLINWRCQGKGPPCFRTKRRKQGTLPRVLYGISTIEKWESENVHLINR